MAELLQNPERIAKAHKAVAEYESLSPKVNFYEADELLDSWLEACKGVDMPLDMMRSLAWMHIERSMGASANGVLGTTEDETDPDVLAADRDASRALILEHMNAALDMFNAVLEDDKVDEATKKEVQWEMQNAYFLTKYWEGSDLAAMREAERSYKQSQVDLLEHALQRHKEDEGVASYALVHAVTASLLIMESTRTMIPMPVAPRQRGFGIDASYRADLYIRFGGGIYSFAVTEDTADWRLRAPASAFATEKGRLSNSLAFAEAVVKDRRTAKTGVVHRGVVPKIEDTSDPTIKLVGNNFVMRLIEQTKGDTEERMPAEKTPLNPFVWYEGLEPGRHPYMASALKLEQGLSEISLAKLNGDLEPSAAVMGGWMYLEAGIGRAMQPIANATSPHGDMDAAEDLFIYAQERTEAGTIDRFDAHLAEAAVPMYRAVATGEEPPFAHYAELLAALGKNVAAFYGSQTDKKSAEAMRADQMIQIITTCLLFAVDPTHSFVVVPSSPRQSEQWHLAAWEITSKGYVPRNIGRLTMAERSATNYDLGAAGISPKDIGQQPQAKRIATLQHLIQHSEQAPVNVRQQREREKAIEKAYKGAVKALIAAFN